MKNITKAIYIFKPGHLIILLSFFSNNAFSQRYVTNIFPALDSTIAAVYGTSINHKSESQDLLFDFYQPQGDTLSYRPLIIYIHGGGFNSGTRELLSVKLLCREMAKKGYAVANIDYRLDPNFDIYNSTTDRRAMTDAMHDAKQAIRYFKANAKQYKLDTTKVFIGGESAGAATSMMAAYLDKQSEMATYPKANPNNPIGNKGNLTHSNEVAGVMCLCGLLLDTNSMESATDPPLLWSHGDKDNFVPISLAFQIVQRAANIGLPIQTRLFKGGVHCPWYYGNPNWEKYLDTTIFDITTFLYPLATKNNTDFNEIEKINIVKIFPNPTSTTLHLNLTKTYSTVKIHVNSILGKEVLYFSSANKSKVQLELEQLNAGIYYLLIELDNEFIIKKIVKK